ncbi:MAG: galactokinase [Deltaproteobacteria bacterium]|nr:galactokinase [Deltaproteobacteria bacterium]
MRSAKRMLEQRSVTASAPCRIDSGGTWDIKALALPLEPAKPVTVNMALNLRTWISLFPHKDGWIKISSEGFPHGEEYPCENPSFDSKFGLFFAAVSHFGLHGLRIHIRSDSPLESSLGGSSTALIALLKALSEISSPLDQKKRSKGEILHLGYHLEDGVSGGYCGIQDQAAAVYGGVNEWTWSFGKKGSYLRRKPLLNAKGQRELSKRILVAFSGKRHVSSRVNRVWVNDFLSGKTRAGWIEVNGVVGLLADALEKETWDEAARLLKEEMAIRRKITPDALIPITERLINQAEKMGCGARFAGAGGGGSLWAVGEKDRIRDLKGIWDKTLAPLRGGRVLECAIDPHGVR